MLIAGLRPGGAIAGWRALIRPPPGLAAVAGSLALIEGLASFRLLFCGPNRRSSTRLISPGSGRSSGSVSQRTLFFFITCTRPEE